MYFKLNKRFNTLKVDDSFAQLLNVDSRGNLQFQFTYSVSQLDAVKKNALKVNVSIVSRTIKKNHLLSDSSNGYVNTKSLVKNILTQVIDAKTITKQQDSFTVLTRSSDISAHINNEIVPLLRAGVPKSRIQTLYKTSLVPVRTSELRYQNEIKPVLQFVAHSTLPSSDIDLHTSSSLNLDMRSEMHKMLLHQSTDPSYITQMSHRSVPAYASISGLSRKTKGPEYPGYVSTSVANYHLLANQADPIRKNTDQLADDVVVHVAQVLNDDTLNIPIKMTIPTFARHINGDDISHFLIKFDLIDGKTGATVDSVTKNLDVARHVQIYYTPNKPPIVNVSMSDVGSRLNLDIKQIDPGATSVQIYKKTIFRSSVEIDDYALVGTYPLTSLEQSLLVQVEKPLYSTVLYRVVPVGQFGNIGFEYTNVVVRPTRSTSIKAISITAKIVDTGISLDVQQIPTSVVSVEILAKNLTTFEPDYRVVQDSIFSIDDATRSSDFISVIDTEVSVGCIYEYVVRITHRNGLSEISGSAIIEFIKLTPGRVDLQINDLEVTNENGEPNVTFTITSVVLDQNIDVVLSLLKRQDIQKYFDNDVAREREFLKSLIAHNVQRIELKTGKREDFGILTQDKFDDNLLRKNSSISPLRYGHKYRYEVTTLLRSAETMFEEFIKSRIDSTTKKTYHFKPAKFLHPITLNRGTIVTAAGLKTRFSKEPLAHGSVGTIESVEVSFDDQPARVIDASCARFNSYLNVVVWKLDGAIDQVDHFLVMKDVHGVRTIVGKAHSEFQYGNCQFVHTLSEFDKGELKYMITPVFNDYRLGIQAVTNTVVV